MGEAEKDLIEIRSLLEMPCQWSVGPIMDRFYAGFEQKKIQGMKCSKCSKVYVPPREVCSDCWGSEMEWAEVPGRGELVNFTVAHVDVRGKKRDEPLVIGMVRLEGAATALYGLVRGVEPDKVNTGMKLEAVWVDKPVGSVKDLHFKKMMNDE